MNEWIKRIPEKKIAWLVIAMAFLMLGYALFLLFSPGKPLPYPYLKGRVTVKLLPASQPDPLSDARAPQPLSSEIHAATVSQPPVTAENAMPEMQGFTPEEEKKAAQTSLAIDPSQPIVPAQTSAPLASHEANTYDLQAHKIKDSLPLQLKKEVKLINTSPIFNPDNKKQMCIILTGLGLDKNLFTAIVDQLDPAITLAFYPFADNTPFEMSEARRRGHELIAMIPMEPLDYPENDPGENTLLTGLTAHENILRLEKLLAPLRDYVGVMNHTGSRFTSSAADFEPVIAELSQRHLLFINHFAAPRSLAHELGVKHNLPVIDPEYTLDPTFSLEKLKEQLDNLAYQAEDSETLVVIVPAYPNIVQAIMEWQSHLSEKPVVLVPISAAVNTNL